MSPDPDATGWLDWEYRNRSRIFTLKRTGAQSRKETTEEELNTQNRQTSL